MKKIMLLFLVALLSACVNPYGKYYRGTEDARTTQGYVPSTQPLQIFSTDNFDRDIPALISKGYFVAGQSSFNAPSNSVSDRQIRKQAEKIGAAAVLVSSKYAGTVTGAVPVTLPHNSSSFTTGTATAFGPGGVVNAFGNATTTTYGSQTVMMPYSVSRSEFGAVFFAKVKNRLGVLPEPLDDQTRRRLDSNLGVRVKLVVEGSPAYMAGIFPGDVILSIGADSIQSPEHFMKVLLPKYEGQTVTVKMDRDGKPIEKEVHLSTL